MVQSTILSFMFAHASVACQKEIPWLDYVENSWILTKKAKTILLM